MRRDMYQLKLTGRAKKELKNIKKIYEVAINFALEEIKEDPFAGKPLARELTGKYSYKIDTYRIVYKISKKDKKIYILTAGHRAKVYE